MNMTVGAAGKQRFLSGTILCIILTGLFCQCSPAHPPRTETERVRLSDIYNLIDDSHLDSLCGEFKGLPKGIPFEIKDKRIMSANRYNRHRLEGPYTADCIELAVEEPCTVSVVITDTLGHTVAWRHFRQDPPPADSIKALAVLFPRLSGWHQYNLLIRDSLLVSGSILLLGKMLHYIDEE